MIRESVDYKVINEESNDKLRKIAKAIRKEAKGRKCSTCRYLFWPRCLRPHDLQGYEVVIWIPDAVACRHHVEIRDDRVHKSTN